MHGGMSTGVTTSDRVEGVGELIIDYEVKVKIGYIARISEDIAYLGLVTDTSSSIRTVYRVEAAPKASSNKRTRRILRAGW